MVKKLCVGEVPRWLTWAFVCVALLVGLSSSAIAGARFVSTASSYDMVYDDVAGILYITNGSDVLRYSVSSGSFLPPFQIGGTLLRGIDLSPDRRTLAVADLDDEDAPWPDGATCWIYLIDTATGQVTKRTFTGCNNIEGGTYSVAFGSDGDLLVTTTVAGSGSAPLRKYDMTTGEFTTVIDFISQDGMLSASADRSVIAWEESNNSSGPFGRYRVSDGDIIHRTGYDYGTAAPNYSVASNRNGTQYIVLFGQVWNYKGASIYNADMIKTGIILEDTAGLPGNAVYDSVRDVLYVSWVGTTKVRAYDTNTLGLIREFDMRGQFSQGAYGVGRLRTAQDGSLLFAIVPNGISYVRPGNNPPTANPQTFTIDEDIPTNITLTGSDPEGEDLTFSVVTPPAHGKLTGTSPNLVYTPIADYNGSDSFTYRASDLDSDSPAVTVSITVNPVVDIPVANAKSVSLAEEGNVNITLTGYDPDSGAPLTYAVVTGPAHGKLQGTPPYLSYRPDFDYLGNDTFTFKVNNGKADSLPAAVSIKITQNLPHQTCSIGAAKNLPNNTYVLIEDAVVTAAGLDYSTFISSSQRSSGIRAFVTTATWQVGQRVRLKGFIKRVDGEYQLSSCSVAPAESSEPLSPLFMVTSTLANDFWEDLNYTGINTTGMLVRLYGKVNAVIPSENVIYINDGVNRPAVIGQYNGVRVKLPTGVALPATETPIMVTGISRVSRQAVTQATERNGKLYPVGSSVYVPMIWPRNAADVWTP